MDAGSSVFSGAGGSLILDSAGPAEALRIANQILRAQGHAPAFELHLTQAAHLAGFSSDTQLRRAWHRHGLHGRPGDTVPA